MISPILKKLIESRGVMTIDGAWNLGGHPGYVLLDWFAAGGKDWHAEAPIHDRHTDLLYAMDQVLYYHERQQYREYMKRLEAQREYDRQGYDLYGRPTLYSR